MFDLARRMLLPMAQNRCRASNWGGVEVDFICQLSAIKGTICDACIGSDATNFAPKTIEENPKGLGLHVSLDLL